MPPFGWVKVSNGSDGAKAEGKVSEVHMWETDDSGIQVICGSSENTIEWFSERGVIFEKASELRGIVFM